VARVSTHVSAKKHGLKPVPRINSQAHCGPFSQLVDSTDARYELHTLISLVCPSGLSFFLSSSFCRASRQEDRRDCPSLIGRLVDGLSFLPSNRRYRNSLDVLERVLDGIARVELGVVDRARHGILMSVSGPPLTPKVTSKHNRHVHHPVLRTTCRRA